jgi:hypothetical protein
LARARVDRIGEGREAGFFADEDDDTRKVYS